MKTEAPQKEVLRLSNEESNRLTRECLRIALLKLVSKEPFEEITITELAKCAGVSRTAFYRNYNSKEDLVEDIFENLFKELTDSISGERFRTDRFNWYVDFIRALEQHSEYFQVYLNANMRHGNGLIIDSVYPPQTIQEHYRNIALEGAFLSILTEWFHTGMKQTPEELALICSQTIDSFPGKFPDEINAAIK